MTETPRGTGHTNTTEETGYTTGGRVLDAEEFGTQQKQSPEEGIPEGRPITLHRDTTITVTSSDTRTQGAETVQSSTSHV